MNFSAAQRALLSWYECNKRELPWRGSRDPYRIWLSETMLQQTTTTAVIPYYERFLARFPTVQALADAPVDAVVEAWAGLGYYSRARNLHAAAKQLSKHFPQTYEELIRLPGLGPYTARSVASLAFDQNVGVVDGNVIRVLSRIHNKSWEWWKPSVRAEIQSEADRWVNRVSSYEMNQALMELGRLICAPKSPPCLLCPVRNHCQGFKANTINQLPLAKPSRAKEIWIWEPIVTIKGKKVLLQRNSSAPFLRRAWLFPGRARPVRVRPRSYDYKHTITHHDIFVTVQTGNSKIKNNGQWVLLEEIRKYAPASLVQKALDHFHSRAVPVESVQVPAKTHRRSSRRRFVRA